MKKYNQSLLAALREANKEYGKNVYLEHKRELKALIEDVVTGDDREEVRRTVSALMTILDNARSYRNFCDILENIPSKISEYEFNLAVSEIERNTAISVEYIKEVLTYIIAAGGGTADIGRQINPLPPKPEPEPYIPSKPEPEIYEPIPEEKKATKKNHTNLIVFLSLIGIFGIAVIITAINDINTVDYNDYKYATYYEETTYEKQTEPTTIAATTTAKTTAITTEKTTVTTRNTTATTTTKNKVGILTYQTGNDDTGWFFRGVVQIPNDFYIGFLHIDEDTLFVGKTCDYEYDRFGMDDFGIFKNSNGDYWIGERKYYINENYTLTDGYAVCFELSTGGKIYYGRWEDGEQVEFFDSPDEYPERYKVWFEDIYYLYFEDTEEDYTLMLDTRYLSMEAQYGKTTVYATRMGDYPYRIYYTLDNGEVAEMFYDEEGNLVKSYDP
jgi:hypothetical protein